MVYALSSGSLSPALPLAHPIPQTPVPPRTVTPAPIRPAADQLAVQTRRGQIPAQAVSFFQAPLPAASFDPVAAGRQNTTAGFSKATQNQSVKSALGPTLKIVAAVAPEIAADIEKMDDKRFLLAENGIKDLFGQHDMYAAWTTVIREKGSARLHFRSMVLDDRFWKLRDAEKASVLMHEMIHANDTPIISNFEKLFGTLHNKIKGVEWGDPVEDRAYLHQYQQFSKLGITEKDEIFWGVQTYLEDRGLIPPYKF